LAARLPLLNYDEYEEADGEVMTTDNWVTVAGSLGGFCTTFAFVPQVLKIWKQGGRDLSYGMLSLYLFGVILWLAYGILLRAQAVIITNFATAILIAIATVLKAWTAKRDASKDVIVAAPSVDKAV
jgi:MtN3 and saliva related transmembrane protein